MPQRGPEVMDRNAYGMLVGWKHLSINPISDLQLKVQNTSGHLGKGEDETFPVDMTRQQVSLLVNYLLKVSEITPQPRRIRQLKRCFSG